MCMPYRKRRKNRLLLKIFMFDITCARERGGREKYGPKEIKIAHAPSLRDPANNKENKPHVSYYISPACGALSPTGCHFVVVEPSSFSSSYFFFFLFFLLLFTFLVSSSSRGAQPTRIPPPRAYLFILFRRDFSSTRRGSSACPCATRNPHIVYAAAPIYINIYYK